MTESRPAFRSRRGRACPLTLVALLSLAACGGGGSGGGSAGSIGAGNSGWTQGVFPPASDFQSLCVNPRTGINPATGRAYADRSGSRTDENNYLRSYSNDTYLWYREIVDRNPALYSTAAYFEGLKSSATTISGTPKDQYHFTQDSAEWYAQSQTGAALGYGVQWALLSRSPPRQLLVAYTDPNTPASAAGLVRGTTILEIDGVDVTNGSDTDTLNNGLSPAAAGESHQFRVRDPDGTERNINLTAQTVTSTPVQNVRTVATTSGNVGYMLFNDHIAPAEQGLIDAFTQLANDNVNDLVIDLRYNGGGFLYIASELAYMIAGNTATANRTFETMRFNDKHTARNPITGETITPMPFFNTSTAGQFLPALNLSRVFVLTGAGTCSASESVINGLRGIGIDVIQIGSRTCGKPYGFYPTDNCGTTYFTIQFRGENEQGFGDYADGFSPQNASIQTTVLPGCQVADDFSQPLGDINESRFAAALQYRENGSCPTPSSIGIPGLGKTFPGDYREDDLYLPKAPWRKMRIVETN